VVTCDAQGACLGRYLGATGRVERLRTAWRKQRTDLGADMVEIASLDWAEVMDDGDIVRWFQL
jgi:hypothetical protein